MLIQRSSPCISLTGTGSFAGSMPRNYLFQFVVKKNDLIYSHRRQDVDFSLPEEERTNVVNAHASFYHIYVGAFNLHRTVVIPASHEMY